MANCNFDVTPTRLVSGLITERGIIRPERSSIHQLFSEEGHLEGARIQDKP